MKRHEQPHRGCPRNLLQHQWFAAPVLHRLRVQGVVQRSFRRNRGLLRAPEPERRQHLRAQVHGARRRLLYEYAYTVTTAVGTPAPSSLSSPAIQAPPHRRPTTSSPTTAA